MAPRKRLAEPDTVVLYRRVSTEEQASSGLGLDAQDHKLREEVTRRGWRVVEAFDDEGYSAKNIAGRPGLVAALAMLDDGGAANLMAAKLDRLSRSVHDFTGMVDRSARAGWNLIVLDIGVDTSTAAGEMMVNVLATFAQFERKLIGERTSAALQALKRDGAVLGRRQRAAQGVIDYVCALRDQGLSLQAVADLLMLNGIPPSQNGVKWYPSSVLAVLERGGRR